LVQVGEDPGFDFLDRYGRQAGLDCGPGRRDNPVDQFLPPARRVGAIGVGADDEPLAAEVGEQAQLSGTLA
jgi:hypothetical protein